MTTLAIVWGVALGIGMGWFLWQRRRRQACARLSADQQRLHRVLKAVAAAEYRERSKESRLH